MGHRVRTSYYKQNRLQQLRGFCYAASAGSISKAAEELQLSQPSVSLQIQALERELGVRLFERRGPKIRLTPDGQMLHELAEQMVEDIDTLRETFAARRGGMATGRLDLAAGGSTILYLLPRYVSAFMAAYPGIQLKLHNVTGRDGLTLLRADEVELAVGSMSEEFPDIVYQPLFSYDTMLIAPADHPLTRQSRVTLKQLSAYPLILPPRHLTTWHVVEAAFHKHGVACKVMMEVGNWECIKEYVRRGIGVSIVSSICLSDQTGLATIPMNGYFPKRTYGVVTRKARVLSPQAQRFIEQLKKKPVELNKG
jgi:DNA-binding transcriptional LysR family regulator